jgi:acetylornithine deacetylase/succinyl-diaminopimelate desuccinylase-like protein
LRSRGGISHAEDEWTDPEHITAGCQVLFTAVLELAGVRSPE